MSSLFARGAWLGAALLLVGCGSSAPVEQPAAVIPTADVVLRSGNIITLDPSFGTVTALAIQGDRIVAVGDDAEIAPRIGASTEVIELAGKTVVPGFIEGHGHFTGLGDSLQILDLKNVASWDEVVIMVQEAVANAKPGEWIVGRGWHQEKWNQPPPGNVEGFPTHESISAVSPNNPVSLRHASGHACFFNHKAMAMAGIDASSSDPPGGNILKNKDGAPTGVFRERAATLVESVREAELTRRSPIQVENDLRRTIQLADEECVSKGVTSFQDAGSPFRTIDVFREMALAGELNTRLYVMVREQNAKLERNLAGYRMIGVGDDRLTVRAIKRTIDGALGSRGAWLLEPYSDAPDSTGLATATIEDVTETARLAKLHGYQLCVHAIGDRANREVLDLFERTFETPGELAEKRWRIEHAQHLHPDDIARFGQLGVIASMQGIHCTSDAPWVVPRLGEKRAAEGAYVWRKLMASGALVTNGTDSPVEDVSPLESYYATVTRKMQNGEAFYPDQAMTRMDALKSYTIHAAAAGFEEDLKGSLTPGKLADLVVLSKDITTVSAAEILETEVLRTMIGGEIVYSRDP